MIRRSVGSRDRLVYWDVDHMGRVMHTARIMLIIYYQIELDKLSILGLTCSIVNVCCWLCIRF
jgi:hypothetical protein